MKLNYFEFCQNLLKDLPSNQKDIVRRRFALDDVSGQGRRETLESIGDGFGITRERVRQIENSGLLKIKSNIKKYERIFKNFKQAINQHGGLKKEDLLLEELGGEKQKPQIYFLLNLADDFKRFSETKDTYSLWSVNKKSLSVAKRTINNFYNKLKKVKKLLSLKDFNCSLPQAAIASYLEISKIVQKNSEGLFGLAEWPEINPRGVKDKAHLIFKKENRPLHFSEVSSLIPNSLVQTVHNELIKDSRFVLIGRGIYGLKEWGYKSGSVKDVILDVLKEQRKPMPREEILNEVFKQRMVKENTILLNLNNKKYFLRDTQGKYIIKEI